MVINIPRIFIGDNFSPRVSQAVNAAIGGASVMMSMAKRDPISEYDLKRKRSPNTNPTRPDNASQNQENPSASKGKGEPLLIHTYIVRKKNPINSLTTFRDREPIFRVARSKARAVIVQNIAVNRAADSPR